MAAKKGSKQGAGSKGKKTAPAVAKKGLAAKGRKAPAAAKKGTAAVTTKHRLLRIGLSNKTNVPIFRTGNNPNPPNTFFVFGDRIGTGNPHPKKVRLRASNHEWTNPPADVQNNGRDALRITAVCNVTRAKRDVYTDDDLSVTIELTDNLGNPIDVTDCHFDDVEYDA
jgi:hypothetical protein